MRSFAKDLSQPNSKSSAALSLQLFEKQKSWVNRTELNQLGLVLEVKLGIVSSTSN